jgi:flagellar protein FlbD
MIPLIRLDGSEVVVNAELIATVEKTPDTMLTLTTGHHILVKQSVDDVVAHVVEYRRRILAGPSFHPGRNSRWILEPSAASSSPSA